MAKPLLCTLDEIEGTDLDLVGGKAFRLAVLRQHAINVPPGLVLTTAFFESQLQHCQLIPLWAGSPDVAVTTESLDWLASTLKIRPLAPSLAREFQAKLTAVFDPDTDKFAVRSSAIDEDQRDHTFAGIHLTELGVPRSALAIAITRCWASALSQPAIKYRQTHGMSIQSIRIAVLIQPMLSPVSSGVGFTINPLTGSRDEMMVEATWGLGEALVSGDIQPYLYKLSAQPPDYPLIEQHAGNVTGPANLTESTGIGPVSVTELKELAVRLEQIQAIMGEAQDVEWARQDDAFFVLQTRPVTLPPQPAQSIDQEWTRGSHPEFLPELPSPLFGSLLERTQDRAMTFFNEIGLDIQGLGPYVKLILGRAYLNLTLLKRAISQVGVNPGSVLHTISHTEPGARGNRLSIDWETAWRERHIYWLVLKRVLNAAHYLKKYNKLVDEISDRLASPHMDAPVTTLLVQFRQHERAYSDLFNTNLGLAVGISAVTTIGSSLLAPLTKNPATLMSSLALQDAQIGDKALNRALLELAYQARHNGQTLKYLQDALDDFQDWPDNPTIPEFRDSFTELSVRFGDQAVYGADVGYPRYEDDPTPLLRIIRQYAQSEHLDEIMPGKQAKRSTLNWDDFTDQVTGLNRIFPWRRWLAALLIKYLRRLLIMRDELNKARARAMTACHRWDLVLGRKWVAQGWLKQTDDIFWLTLEEVERALMVGDNAGITLSPTVQARKETYQTYAQTEMPFTLLESELPYIQLGIGLSTEALSEVMVGLPISPGQVQGTVLVLQDPNQFEQIAEQIVVVIPSTDPAWLPLLHLADGLIVETGGLLSHGSVIAREYGLPAVANIPQATKRFRTGDSVLVDGSTGVVQLIQSA
jgi:phosphohistidine swiveling domain-containing protein